MKDTMEYKGYRARITFEPDDDTFHGTVVNIDDTIHFEGQSVDDLKQAFRDSVDDYLDFCRERGRAPEKPYSGTLSLRLSPDVHRSVVHAAKLRGKSVNAFISEAVESAIEQDRD